MMDSETPIRSSSARFRGARRGQGIVLLYPDKLAAVNSPAGLWGAVLGPIVLVAASHLVFRHIPELGLGPAVGIPVGTWIGESIGKRLAAGNVAAGGDGARLIPLDLITSVRFRNAAGIRRWLMGQALLVTTADGAEYEFRGWLGGWQAALADALTVRGCDVLDTPQGITVPPRSAGAVQLPPA